jgi:hypothetical protein
MNLNKDQIQRFFLYMLYGETLIINMVEYCYLNFRQYEEIHLHYDRLSQRYKAT